MLEIENGEYIKLSDLIKQLEKDREEVENELSIIEEKWKNEPNSIICSEERGYRILGKIDYINKLLGELK